MIKDEQHLTWAYINLIPDSVKLAKLTENPSPPILHLTPSGENPEKVGLS